MKTSRKPAPVHGGPADHVVGEAASRRPGTGTDTQPGSDWMAEMSLAPGKAPGRAPEPPPGVPVSTRSRGDRHRGQAVESRRGQRGG